jgi:2-phosphosulfolactate phosphatase
MRSSHLNVTVIACGEREKEPPHDLRPAIEDYLGAAAILSYLSVDKSPEAQVCESAFKANKERIDRLVWDSVSARELREIGFGDDVRFAARMNAFDTIPSLKNDAFVNFPGCQA